MAQGCSLNSVDEKTTTNELEQPDEINNTWGTFRSLQISTKLTVTDGREIIIQVSNGHTEQDVNCNFAAADKLSVAIEGNGVGDGEKDTDGTSSVQAVSVKAVDAIQNNASKEIENETEALKKLVLESAIKVTDKELPAVYELQMHETYVDEINQVRKMELGEPSQNDAIPEKVVMIVGETGCGKTTHINSIVNYIYGVNYADPFRFRILTDLKERSLQSDQAESQTQWVTGYTFHHQAGCQQNCTLTLIDTPGFGDTGGIVNDQKIVERIKKFFTIKEGIDHIDAVGFVVKASSSRLTPTEMYVFDSILSLFGKDIGDNIVIFITFADARPPPVIATLKKAGLKYKSLVKFNNSAVFASNEDGDENAIFDQMFWKMGMRSFETFFFTELMRLQPKSLTLTRDVLNEREALQVHVVGIRQQIDEGLGMLHQLEVEIDVIKKHKSDIDRNRNFTYTSPEQEIVTEKIRKGEYTTNCITCNRTCHRRCAYANDEDKKKCLAMDSDGKCKICCEHCHWTEHRNMPYRYKIVTKMVEKPSTELLNNYNDAQGRQQSARRVAQCIYEDYLKTRVKVLNTVRECNECLKRLHEIALKPNPLSEVDYIDKLLEAEERNKRAGFRERKQQLLDIRVLASRLQEMQSGDILEVLTDNEERVAQKYKEFIEPEKAWNKIFSKFSDVQHYLSSIQTCKKNKKNKKNFQKKL